MANLLNYQLQTSRLLGNPSGVPEGYLLSDITQYINLARDQISSKSRLVQVTISFSTTSNKQAYSLPNIPTNTQGISQIIDIQSVLWPSGTGFIYLTPRSWEWFRTYNLNTATQSTGDPKEWTQYGPGANGALYLSPVPSVITTLVLDSICQPMALGPTNDAEAIPYPWTEAIPYFAAYLTLLGSERHEEAMNMFEEYLKFEKVAELAGRPSAPPSVFDESASLMTQNKLGMVHKQKVGE